MLSILVVCNGDTGASLLTITGHGGLPPNPLDPLTPDVVRVDLITLNPDKDKVRIIIMLRVSNLEFKCC